MSILASFKPPTIGNEPNHHFAKGSVQRSGLDAAIKSLRSQLPLQVPLVIGGKEVKSSTATTLSQVNPAEHATIVAEYSTATDSDVALAIESALAAKPMWESLPFVDRAAIFLKAADLIATKYRYDLVAATMLGQGKNAWQAEVDAAAELIDFLRFNVKYAADMYGHQPDLHSPSVWNRVEYRPLEGFVYAITPFNFTAISGNLSCLPALLGNVVVWKPSDYSIASSWVLYNILLEAGLPRGVIQFVPGDARAITSVVLAHRSLAALHFTGSTAVFRDLYGQIGAGIAAGRYIGYPRLVGETGGKNFHLIHSSAEIENAVVHTVRGAFEYQGQKCSATSRLYVPKSIWPQFSERLIAETRALKVGPPWQHGNMVGAVIHEASFDRLAAAIESGRLDAGVELLTGGHCDKSTGYFVHPTIFRVDDPHHKIVATELFGPVLAVYVYDDAAGAGAEAEAVAFAAVCDLVDGTSIYGLTGAVFAADRAAVRVAEERLRNAAGNFYINCKSTGAMVGQQPFGGARASGTNDKGGSSALLARFVSMRTIKEEFVASKSVLYPSNEV